MSNYTSNRWSYPYAAKRLRSIVARVPSRNFIKMMTVSTSSDERMKSTWACATTYTDDGKSPTIQQTISMSWTAQSWNIPPVNHTHTHTNGRPTYLKHTCSWQQATTYTDVTRNRREWKKPKHIYDIHNVQVCKWLRSLVVRALNLRLNGRRSPTAALSVAWYWDGWPSSGGSTTSVCNQPPRPTQPPTLCGTANKYRPKLGYALWLGVKIGWLIPFVVKRVGGR